MSDSSAGEVLFRQAAAARNNHEYARAEDLQQQGLALWRQQDERFARELENLAGIHFIQEKFELAASEYERALELRERLVPDDDSGALRVLYWLAKSHFQHQQYNSAETAMRRALSIIETRHDSLDDLAHWLYELGFLLYFVGRYQEAEVYLLRALALYEPVKGLSHPDTVKVLERIALNYSNCPAIGKDPEPYFRRAVEGIKPEGETRLTYIENLCRLAGHVAGCRRFEDADKLFSQLLNLIEASEKSDEPADHWVVSDCVRYFQSRGKGESVIHLASIEEKYDAYGEMVRRKLEHAEQTLPSDDPNLGEALFNSGNQALFEGRYEEAETLLKRALDTKIAVHGEKGESVVQALNRLCVVSRLLKKFDVAEGAIQEALAIASELYAAQYVFPSTLETFAALREAQARIGEATDFYDQAVLGYERICGFPSYEAAEALYRQSGYFLRISELSRAEEKARRAISAMDQIDELSDYERSDYMNTLASILDATGQNSESAALKIRAEELSSRRRRRMNATIKSVRACIITQASLPVNRLRR
jgi:tetratricopeptide (TPR) repeat protein